MTSGQFNWFFTSKSTNDNQQLVNKGTEGLYSVHFTM